MYNPAIGYFQGMSDLVAPILAEVLDESDTFWCFVGLMQNTIFVSSPRDEDMEKQLVRLGDAGYSMPVGGARRLLPWLTESLGAACVVATVGPQAERPGRALPMEPGGLAVGLWEDPASWEQCTLLLSPKPQGHLGCSLQGSNTGCKVGRVS